MFEKYIHLEKWDTEETEGIGDLSDDLIYIFPKLDGTNASIWYDSSTGSIRCGSRRREIYLHDDNRGFCDTILNRASSRILPIISQYPDYVFYGEWLVRHTLSTYLDEAWNKFYIFDVYNRTTQKYISYPDYLSIVGAISEAAPDVIDVVRPLAVAKQLGITALKRSADENYFLMKEGEVGEGVVVKKYNFVNKYGRTVWAKYVRTEFTAKHIKEMGPRVINSMDCLEQTIVDDYLTEHLILKTYEKLRDKYEFPGDLPSRHIAELLQTVFYDFVTEEIWEVIKKLKYPTINFKQLHRLCYNKTKEVCKI